MLTVKRDYSTCSRNCQKHSLEQRPTSTFVNANVTATLLFFTIYGDVISIFTVLFLVNESDYIATMYVAV